MTSLLRNAVGLAVMVALVISLLVVLALLGEGESRDPKLTAGGDVVREPIYRVVALEGDRYAGVNRHGQLVTGDFAEQEGKPAPIVLEGYFVKRLDRSPVDGRILFGDHDGNIGLWDAQTGTVEIMARFPRDDSGQPQGVSSLEFLHDGSRICAGSDAGVVGVWETGTWQGTMWTVRQQRTGIHACFLQGGNRLAVCNRDGTVEILDVADQSIQARLELGMPGPAGIVGFAVQPWVAWCGKTSHYQHAVQLWNVETQQCLWSRDVPPAASSSCVRFSADGSRLAYGSDRGLFVFDSSDGDAIVRRLLDDDQISSIHFRDDSHSFISCGVKGMVCVWETETLAKLREHQTELVLHAPRDERW
jgi:WD40 repeat protein